MENLGKNNSITYLWALSFWLCLLSPACNDGIITDEGFFDRYDACERYLSLCEIIPPEDLATCVDWLLENFSDTRERILQVGCMLEAETCREMIVNCNMSVEAPAS